MFFKLATQKLVPVVWYQKLARVSVNLAPVSGACVAGCSNYSSNLHRLTYLKKYCSLKSESGATRGHCNANDTYR